MNNVRLIIQYVQRQDMYFNFAPFTDMCAWWATPKTLAKLTSKIRNDNIPLSTRNCSCCAFKESISYCWSDRILSSLFWIVFGSLDSSEPSNSCSSSAAIFPTTTLRAGAVCAICVCQGYWSTVGNVFLSHVLHVNPKRATVWKFRRVFPGTKAKGSFWTNAQSFRNTVVGRVRNKSRCLHGN